MRRIAVAVALGLSLAAAAAEQASKPSAEKTGPGAPANPGTLVAKPDLVVGLDGQYLTVANRGDADWTGPVDVVGTCKSTAPGATPDACGASFPNGQFGYHMASLLPGHGAAASPAPPAASGPGWRALALGLPAGTYNVNFTVDPHAKVPDANRANNTITKTITIANLPPTSRRPG